MYCWFKIEIYLASLVFIFLYYRFYAVGYCDIYQSHPELLPHSLVQATTPASLLAIT